MPGTLKSCISLYVLKWDRMSKRAADWAGVKEFSILIAFIKASLAKELRSKVIDM